MPFKVSTIVLYLQVHVICNAVYYMLLGRPFNILTKSVIKNFDNEDQTITIECPNTGQIATISTIPWGGAPFCARPNPKPARTHYLRRVVTTSPSSLSWKTFRAYTVSRNRSTTGCISSTSCSPL